MQRTLHHFGVLASLLLSSASGATIVATVATGTHTFGTPPLAECDGFGCTAMGSITKTYVGPNAAVFAEARGGYETPPDMSNVRNLKVPTFHSKVVYTGYEGAYSSWVEARLLYTANWLLDLDVNALDADTPMVDLNFATFTVSFFDEGSFTVPEQSHFIWTVYAGGKTASYSRDFSASTFGIIPTYPYATIYTRELTSPEPGGQTHRDFADHNSQKFIVQDAFRLRSYGKDIVSVRYETITKVSTEHFLDASMGTGISDWQNTSGISRIELFDANGLDITKYLTVRDADSGEVLFASSPVPEPKSLLLVSVPLFLGLFVVAHRRRNQSIVDRVDH